MDMFQSLRFLKEPFTQISRRVDLLATMYTNALNCTDPILSVQLKRTKFSSCSYIYEHIQGKRYENLISSNLALFGIVTV